MKIKYFYPNKYDKIEFTKQELEKLISDVYEEGRSDGNNNNIYYPSIIYNEQSTKTTPYLYCTDTNSIGNTIIETTTYNSVDWEINNAT